VQLAQGHYTKAGRPGAEPASPVTAGLQLPVATFKLRPVPQWPYQILVTTALEYRCEYRTGVTVVVVCISRIPGFGWSRENDKNVDKKPAWVIYTEVRHALNTSFSSTRAVPGRETDRPQDQRPTGRLARLN